MHSLHRLASRATRLRRFSAPADVARALEEARGADLAKRAELAGSLSSSWEACELGEAQTLADGAGAVHTFALRSRCGVELASVRAAIFGAGGNADVATALMFGPACDPALPLALAARPLVAHAIGVATAAHGAERIAAVARLPGLCAWIVATRAWDGLDAAELGDDAAGAVEAVARGVPRPGHSVLGQGTFAAAQPAFERLATRFAEERLATDADAEVGAFLSAGAELVGVHWMHDKSPPALRDSGGCTASFQWPE